jgi:hypothetical protein
MLANSLWKPIIVSTLVCGTLDILLAIFLTFARGKEPAAMLRFVASGPFPRASDWGSSGAFLGLAVHYALMAIMVAAFVLAARNLPLLIERPLLSGLVYGLITYVIMNLLVVPFRFPAAWPPKALGVGTQLFAHIVLVGWPLAAISRSYMSPTVLANSSR